jgi:hypothetical protein
MASALIIAKKRQQREEFQQAITAQEEGTNLRTDKFGTLKPTRSMPNASASLRDERASDELAVEDQTVSRAFSLTGIHLRRAVSNSVTKQGKEIKNRTKSLLASIRTAAGTAHAPCACAGGSVHALATGLRRARRVSVNGAWQNPLFMSMTSADPPTTGPRKLTCLAGIGPEALTRQWMRMRRGKETLGDTTTQ